MLMFSSDVVQKYISKPVLLLPVLGICLGLTLLGLHIIKL